MHLWNRYDRFSPVVCPRACVWRADRCCVPHQGVIVREREYIVTHRPVAPAPVVYARPVPVPYTGTLAPAEVEVEPYVAVPVVRRPYFGPREWDR
jgi:hypothetical protein